jgi:hypothetical protein
MLTTLRLQGLRRLFRQDAQLATRYADYSAVTLQLFVA